MILSLLINIGLVLGVFFYFFFKDPFAFYYLTMDAFLINISIMVFGLYLIEFIIFIFVVVLIKKIRKEKLELNFDCVNYYD
jgi:hypothetical protein